MANTLLTIRLVDNIKFIAETVDDLNTCSLILVMIPIPNRWVLKQTRWEDEVHVIYVHVSTK